MTAPALTFLPPLTLSFPPVHALEKSVKPSAHYATHSSTTKATASTSRPSLTTTTTGDAAAVPSLLKTPTLAPVALMSPTGAVVVLTVKKRMCATPRKTTPTGARLLHAPQKNAASPQRMTSEVTRITTGAARPPLEPLSAWTLNQRAFVSLSRVTRTPTGVPQPPKLPRKLPRPPRDPTR